MDLLIAQKDLAKDSSKPNGASKFVATGKTKNNNFTMKNILGDDDRDENGNLADIMKLLARYLIILLVVVTTRLYLQRGRGQKIPVTMKTIMIMCKVLTLVFDYTKI